jgi:hypothetical protein
MNPVYVATAELLVEVAPVVFGSGQFALKGGTAINLFFRNVPRLSVDLDLVFLDHRLPRGTALAAINEALRVAKHELGRRGLKVHPVSSADTGETKLIVQRDDISVKIEVNTVIRGTVHPARRRGLTPSASDMLMADVELPLLAEEEIYGSKLVAAMDRQHPRDLFDVREMLAHGGLTPGITQCFVVYLASHNRTIHEVLCPAPKDISLAYDSAFVGMTALPVSLAALRETRDRLFRDLPSALSVNEREFLRTLLRAEPDWSLIPIPHLQELPAIRWRLQNVQKLALEQPRRHRQLCEQLDAALDGLS